MLSIMRKGLCGVLVLLCCISECVAQSKSIVPELQELGQSESVGHNSVQLSAEEISLLKNLTRKIISVCVDDPGLGDAHTRSGMFSRIRVRRVSLTPKGDSGLVVQGSGVCMCGAVGNCPFWVIDEQPHPNALLHAVGVQSFAIQKSSSADHFDLVLGSHDSAIAIYLQRFKFDGTRYRPSSCASLEWSDPVGNALHPPRITNQPCP
jgi:hypothetical protein